MQRQLWRSWLDFWDWVGAQKGSDPLTVIINGDAADADAKQRSTQLITRNKSTILTLALNALEPALSIADRAVFIRGTGAHVGKSAWMEEEIAKDCDITVRASKDQASWWKLYASCDKVRILVRHVGPPPGRDPATYLNPLMRYAYALSTRDPMRPNLSIASHNHRMADTFDAYPCRHIAVGCWQGPNEYSYSRSWVDGPDIGGLLVRVDGAGYTVRARRYELQRERAIDL